KGAAVRVHSRQFLDEADVTVIRFEVYRGERKPSLFHSNLLALIDVQVTPFSFQKCYAEEEKSLRVILQNFCGHSYDSNIFAMRKLLHRSRNYFSRRCFFSFFFAHSSASAGAGLRSMIAGHFAASSRLSGMNGFCASGTSSSAKIASTGHSGTHRV